MNVRLSAASRQNRNSGLSQGLQGSNASDWAVWLLGQLPRERVAPAIVGLQGSAPRLYYAISLLWSFMESWIAPPLGGLSWTCGLGSWKHAWCLSLLATCTYTRRGAAFNFARTVGPCSERCQIGRAWCRERGYIS